MGFLDKLFGRNKDDAAEGTQTAPPPATPPADAPPADAPPAETEPHEHGEPRPRALRRIGDGRLGPLRASTSRLRPTVPLRSSARC